MLVLSVLTSDTMKFDAHFGSSRTGNFELHGPELNNPLDFSPPRLPPRLGFDSPSLLPPQTDNNNDPGLLYFQ